MQIIIYYLKNRTKENEVNTTDILRFIRESLEQYIYHASTENEVWLSFDECIIKEEFKLSNLFFDACKDRLQEFYECLNGENYIHNISFSFTNTIFEKYPSFDNIHCKSLGFYNTVFKQGAKIRWVTAKEIDYGPRILDADVTFAHEGYADIDNGKLSVPNTSSIQKLKFRHNLEGNGWTYFIGLRITEKADFTNSVLNKVHFSNMDMSKCYFANAIIQDTRFINCDFPKTKDLWTAAMSKSGYLSTDPKIYGMIMSILVGIVLLTASLLLISEEIKGWGWLSILIVLAFPFLIYPFLFFNRFLFGWHKRMCMHFSTADEKLAFEEKDPVLFTKNIGLLREVYRQLRTNLEKNNDFQKAGEFYFSQRHIETALFDFEDPTKSAMQQLLMYSLHWINGFGERWLRSLIWFMLTILTFSFVFVQDSDYIATTETPAFLLLQNDNNSQMLVDYKDIVTFSLPQEFNQTKFANNENILYQLNPAKDANNTITVQKKVKKLNDSFTVKLTYSLSHLVAPFTPDEKKWFTTYSEKAYALGFLETALLWLFAFAAGVAINNRIKR